jgi:hypothetical protein
MWSRWPWVRKTRRRRRRALEPAPVGQDQVDAEVLGVGEQHPDVDDGERPSTSMVAMLRPISPRPPRKVTLTGWLTWFGSGRRSAVGCRLDAA